MPFPFAKRPVRKQSGSGVPSEAVTLREDGSAGCERKKPGLVAQMTNMGVSSSLHPHTSTFLRE
jgi:hypothetical protein